MVVQLTRLLVICAAQFQTETASFLHDHDHSLRLDGGGYHVPVAVAHVIFELELIQGLRGVL